MSFNYPRISVLLPVYNGDPFLASSIDSVLSQSYVNFELLILNDGSSDRSAEIAKSYSDERIRYFEHPNIGLAATLNKGASLARGEFLLRQDQDDLSYSDRFAKQIAYLENHPEVALLGTWARIISEKESDYDFRYHKHPTSQAAIAFNVIFDSPFVHSSIVMRRSAFEELGGYSCDPIRQPPEDFELWSRFCRKYQVANLDEVLVDYRELSSSMSRLFKRDFSERMIRISTENLCYWLKDSAFVPYTNKLASIYHMNGVLPTDSTDGKIIESVMKHISRSHTLFSENNNTEFIFHLKRVRNQIMRNYWLGRCSSSGSRLIVKAGFRILSNLHGK